MDALDAGVEATEVRSARFEENENIDVQSEYAETLAETAVEQLREVIESAEVDETTGEIVVYARTPQGLEIEDRLHSFAELHSFLREFGFDPDSELLSTEEWGFGYGGPIKLLRREIDALLTETDAADLFATVKPLGTNLFRVETGVLVPEVRIELASVNDQLVKFLAAHPEQLYSLGSRKFEELVQAIFRDFGYFTELTRNSKDGGLDIRAIRKDTVGTLLYLIECKKYAPERPVGIGIVRGLYGVTTAERATRGLIVTTSHFTRGAEVFAEKNQYQLSLHGYHDLVRWLNQYPVSNKPKL